MDILKLGSTIKVDRESSPSNYKKHNIESTTNNITAAILTENRKVISQSK